MHISNSLLLAALSTLASAQTWTACNPTVNETCPNDPAMKESFDTDFRKGEDSIKGWTLTAGKLDYKDSGAEFTMHKRYDSVTIQSETYLFFGYIEVKMKAATGKGIISSIVVQSEDLDEVDWEFIGLADSKVQTNYFGKGNTTTYDRMVEAPVSKPQDTFHTYALDWKPESLTWLIDGVAVRTLKAEDANGGKNYPQTPSTVRLGIWAGGDPDNSPGTIEWAGGETDFSKAPFTMTVESVKVKNYNPGTEYKWTDKSGSWKSIEVVGKGKTEGSPDNEKPISKSAAPTPTGGKVEGPGIGAGSGSTASVPTGGSAKPTETENLEAPGQKTIQPWKPSKSGQYVPGTTACPTGAAGNSTGSDCDCGTYTVTVTGESPVPTPTGAKNGTYVPPAVTVPATPSTLKTDGAPKPSAPVPTGNSTTPPPAEFTGAAATFGQGKAIVGALVLGAMAFVL